MPGHRIGGQILPVIITVYSDKSFDFVVKTPPVAVQLLEATKLKKGSLNQTGLK
jgi:large subunit ribosomal protein L11